MSIEQLFIPSKIKVGFQKRQGTYTGKLAYVVYIDDKGKLRKEKSWEGWRHKDIPPIDCDNQPVDGFVLNKDVGGTRHSYGSWNARIEKVRVYDPRDFEFEISIPNLLFILREGDCSRGKGLEGKFVYSWSGTELILLPVACQEYKNSTEFTKLQSQSVKMKEMVKGGTYITKQQEKLIYLGKLDKHTLPSRYGYRKADPPLCQRHVFQDEKNGYVFLEGMKTIAAVISDTAISDLAERVDAYNKSVHGAKVASLSLGKFKKPRPPDNNYWYDEYWAYAESPSVFVQCSTRYNYQDKTKIEYTQTHYKVTIKDGALVWTEYSKISYPENTATDRRYHHYHGQSVLDKFLEPTDTCVYAKLESGSEYRLGDHALYCDPPLKEVEVNG